jgi:DNA-binding PadR family transcriptional regulator
MAKPKLTLLGYILLGLLRKQPQSGYELQQLFTATPLMNYSNSPGAIYPALRRLKEQKLIADELTKSGARVRRIHAVTEAGLQLLRDWLREPVSESEVTRDVGLLMLRFSLMDAALGRRRSLGFLREAEPRLAEQASRVKAFFRNNGQEMPLSGRLALDFGVRSYDTLLQWTRDAIAAYEND